MNAMICDTYNRVSVVYDNAFSIDVQIRTVVNQAERMRARLQAETSHAMQQPAAQTIPSAPPADGGAATWKVGSRSQIQRNNAIRSTIGGETS